MGAGGNANDVAGEGGRGSLAPRAGSIATCSGSGAGADGIGRGNGSGVLRGTRAGAGPVAAEGAGGEVAPGLRVVVGESVGASVGALYRAGSGGGKGLPAVSGGGGKGGGCFGTAGSGVSAAAGAE